MEINVRLYFSYFLNGMAYLFVFYLKNVFANVKAFPNKFEIN